MGQVKETFNATPIAISGPLLCSLIGAFVSSTAGTFQVRDKDATGTVRVLQFPVAAGVVYPLPLATPSGAYFELGGGCTGTVLWV